MHNINDRLFWEIACVISSLLEVIFQRDLTERQLMQSKSSFPEKGVACNFARAKSCRWLNNIESQLYPTSESTLKRPPLKFASAEWLSDRSPTKTKSPKSYTVRFAAVSWFLPKVCGRHSVLFFHHILQLTPFEFTQMKRVLYCISDSIMKH